MRETESKPCAEHIICCTDWRENTASTLCDQLLTWQQSGFIYWMYFWVCIVLAKLLQNMTKSYKSHYYWWIHLSWRCLASLSRSHISFGGEQCYSNLDENCAETCKFPSKVNDTSVLLWSVWTFCCLGIMYCLKYLIIHISLGCLSSKEIIGICWVNQLSNIPVTLCLLPVRFGYAKEAISAQCDNDTLQSSLSKSKIQAWEFGWTKLGKSGKWRQRPSQSAFC